MRQYIYYYTNSNYVKIYDNNLESKKERKSNIFVVELCYIAFVQEWIINITPHNDNHNLNSKERDSMLENNQLR